MNNVQIFSNREFGEIRTIIIDGEPWFVAKDISEKLGYAQTANMLKQVDTDDKQKFVPSKMDDAFSNMTRQSTIVNESGLYAAIFGSKQENAKRFKKWVTSEVLPSIRRTGTYGVPQLPQNNMELLELHYKALKEVDSKVATISAEVGSVREDLENLKMDLPILPIEADKITNATKAKGVSVMGGKQSNAYANRSIVNAVYKDIYSQIYRNFGVTTYKAIKRSQTDKVLIIIEEYKPPVVLQDRIEQENAQQKLNV